MCITTNIVKFFKDYSSSKILTFTKPRNVILTAKIYK